MNSVPCAISRFRRVIRGTALLVSLVASTAVGAAPLPPSWWSQGAPPPVSGTPQGLAVANLGQAKYMAKCALEALKRTEPAVGQLVEANLVGVGKPIPSWATPVAGSAAAQAQYAPLLVGQLKAIADPFYRQLNAAAPLWLASQRSANGTQDPGASTFIFPWTSVPTDDSNKAMASVGQLTAVFALRFDADSDANSLPDLWEYGYLGHLGNSASADADGDGITNLEEYQRGLNPTVADRAPGKLLVERWNNVFSYSVPELIASSRIYGTADSTYWAAPQDLKFSGQYFGTRSRGYVTPTVTGDYTFWISARTSAELWLSSDLTFGKYAKRRIAAMGSNLGNGNGIGWRDANLWDQFPSQQSAKIHLVAGQAYYMEILLQHGHTSDAHSSVAWARDGGVREGLPSAVVSAYLKTPDDVDDDYLPDAWERQYGLNPADNGAYDHVKQGERGDFDGDGLTNRDEYLLGTNPANSDTDGDGVSDAEEVNSLGTNPLVANISSDTLVGEVALGGFTSSSTGWTMTSGGLIADSFRGEATWNFTVPTAGNWLLRLNAELMGSTFGNEDVPIVIKVDGKIVVRRNVRFSSTNLGLLQALTPWLAAGNHQVTVLVDNMLARRTVRLVSLKIYVPSNPSAILAQSNHVIARDGTSRTSPAFLEGYARDVSSVTVNGIAAVNGTGKGHWFANLPLTNQSNPQSYAVHFEQGSDASGTLVWQATNVMDAESITIRQGDSIRAGAWGADLAMTSTITLSSGGSWSLTGGQTIALTFGNAGTFTVNGRLQNGATAVLTVKVVGAPNFPLGIIDVLNNFTRTLSLTAAQEVAFDAPEDFVRLSATRNGTITSVALLSGALEEFSVAARLLPGGPILAVQRVNVIGISDALENDFTTVAAGGINGYKIYVTPLTVLNLPQGGRVDLSIFRAGVMFTNGSTRKSIYPADLTNGSVNVEFLYPLGLSGGYCHNLLVYDRKGVYLGTR